MNKPLLTLTVSALFLASSAGLAQAQQTTGEQTMQQDQQAGQHMMQRDRQGRMGRDARRGGHHGMRSYGRMGHDMMRQRGHARGHHDVMMQMMFAIIDADGDGTLSLEEVQDAVERVFNHMDANDDGQLTKEEIRAFYQGQRKRGRTPAPDGDPMPDMNEADDDNDD